MRLTLLVAAARVKVKVVWATKTVTHDHKRKVLVFKEPYPEYITKNVRDKAFVLVHVQLYQCVHESMWVTVADLGFVMDGIK